MTIKTLAADTAGLIGALSISYGSWLIYEPAGFIIGGALILASALLSTRGG